jgi:uncharacterized membrane protein
MVDLAGEWSLPPVPPHKTKPGVGRQEMNIRRAARTNTRTRDLALVATFASLYAVLVFAFAPISFGPLQFRLAGALRPGIARRRVLAVGYALGVAVGNLFTPFPLYYEVLFMPLMSLFAGLAGFEVAKLLKRRYLTAGAVTAAIISLSVSWMLSQPLVLSLPMILTFPPLFVAEQIVCVLGAAVFKLVDKRFKWW